MKLRTGFVSNSSSSSFILAASGSPGTIKVEVPLTDIVSKTINSITELNLWFIDKWAWEDGTSLEKLLEDEWAKKKYEKMSALIKAGQTLYIGTASNEDYSEMWSMYLYTNRFKGVIFSEKVDIVEDISI